MDPLSITGTVIAITAQCLSTAKTLYGLREKFKEAQFTISTIYSESRVIAASLSQVQMLVLKDPEHVQSDLETRPELESLFDNALTGCMVVYSALEKEIQDLNIHPSSVRERAAIVWKEDTMKGLLQQIQGQQGTLSLLIQTLQMFVPQLAAFTFTRLANQPKDVSLRYQSLDREE